MQKAFSHYAAPQGGGWIDDLSDNFPSTLHCWVAHRSVREFKAVGSTFYGFVESGYPLLRHNDMTVTLRPGAFFCAPGNVWISGGNGIIIERKKYNGVFNIGGPIEKWGRLRYIDGCTDTLLISPQRKGEPCLNALYFPEGIDQTMHTHPSDRIGIIISGRGQCETPTEGVIELVPGMMFCIHANGPHRFRTPHGEEMTVIAYHPDSDFGPEDETHPMVNRTMVGEVSASHLKDIQTTAETFVTKGLL